MGFSRSRHEIYLGYGALARKEIQGQDTKSNAKVHEGKTKTFGTKTTTLVLPTTYKAKRYMAKTWHNPYTDKRGQSYAKRLSPMKASGLVMKTGTDRET